MANNHLLIRTRTKDGRTEYYFIPKDCIGPPVVLNDKDGGIESKIAELKRKGVAEEIDFAIWITDEEKVDNIIRGRN